MPQEKGWYLHGGDIHELWAKVGRRVDELIAEAEKVPDMTEGQEKPGKSEEPLRHADPRPGPGG